MPNYIFPLHKDACFFPHRMASLGVCTLAAPPAGWLLSWQQLVPTIARWISPWGWSIASRDTSLPGKAPGRHMFQKKRAKTVPKARIPVLDRYRKAVIGGQRVPLTGLPSLSSKAVCLFHALGPECTQQGLFPFGSSPREFIAINCS